MFIKQHTHGFTLIEVIIYLALFSVLMSGILVSTYPIFTHSERLAGHVLRESESAFIVEKIRNMLALSIIDTNSLIREPQEGATSTMLQIERNGNEILSLTIDDSLTFCTPPRICSMLVESEGDTSPLPLNNERIQVQNFLVTHHAPTLNTPRTIEVSFTANGELVGPVIYALQF